jgi:hypothetical protein
MRFILAATFALASVGAYAADEGAAPGAAAPADAKAVNTVCVMCGKPVDAAVKPVAGKTKDGKVVMIGCCSQKCADDVAKSPDTYVDAAVNNQKYSSKAPAAK